MFLKSLIIESPVEIIRNIEFKPGLNIIIDDTPSSEAKATGNNVGKTTVLKLIDFCLGANSNIIYIDPENKKEVYQLVKDYLIENEIKVSIELVESFDDPDVKKIFIQRNFLTGKKVVRTINGKDVLDKDFEEELLKLLFPNQKAEKPSLRQIISHNIRYKDENINNTLKTLDRYTTDVEYETLNLYLLGCSFDEGAKKQKLLTKKTQEETFKTRLEKKQTKTAYEIALAMLDDEIDALNEKKATFNLNENFEHDLDCLNNIKYNINKYSSSISKLKIRKELIEDTKKELEESISTIDLKQLENLYSEAKMNISGIQKTFKDLVNFHNNMIIEKSNFIAEDLPIINEKLKHDENELAALLKEEKVVSEKVARGESFEELEKIINELNDKYRDKGEYENIIAQLNDVEENIGTLNTEIKELDEMLFSDDFEERLKIQINKFNKYFSRISQELYGERYALKYDKEINKKKQQFYKFSAFNANMSSGKKQGEILCFDLAYILFADEEELPCLHFLLNDKKELMHDNQLIKVAEFVKEENIQLVISILKDKLPDKVLENAHLAVELSQDSKLFKIEE